ncbi:hypothetical protein DXG01_003516 [Tephrocybe rancida]|nr:hypothetical protein DXG01_003516 [Tephrocybe rancida]
MANTNYEPWLPPWLAIPLGLCVSAYCFREYWKLRQLRLYGIGKGAPGFQTNVRQVRVTPAIAARIRRGETVSPEEIAAAAKEAEESGNGEEAPEPRTNSLAGRGVVEEVQLDQSKKGEDKEEEKNEWLPDNITTPRKRAKGRKA